MTPETLASVHAAAFVQSRPWSADEFQDLLANAGCFAVGDTSGFAFGRVIVDEVELLTLAVHPDVQRTGAGRRWLSQYENTARVKGAIRSFLEVADDNTAAISLYQSQGYALAGTRPKYYARSQGPAVAALIFSRSLP